MVSKTGVLGRSMFEYQAPTVLDQGGPIQNTWYNILVATERVRVYAISVNVEDANEDLEVQIIIDGETINGIGVTATHSTAYNAVLEEDAINGVDYVNLKTGYTDRGRRAFLIEGHSVQIQVRKTTANGAGNLTGLVEYGVLKNV